MTQFVSNRFEDALSAQGTIILDGGLATELEARGYDIGTKLWSAALLHSNPSAIIDAHLAYLEAGADIIITASYQATVPGFMSLGYSSEEAEEIILRSVELACAARRQFCESHPGISRIPLIAASIGPYGAALHDGSEYTGEYDIDATGLRKFHEQRLELLDKTDADLLACETIPNKLEAAVLCELLKDIRLPAWVSFCCRDGLHLSDGTPLRKVCAQFDKHPRVRAAGINCTPPHFVTSLIAEIRTGAPDLSVVVYPNAGESYDVSSNSWRGDASSDVVADFARDWAAAGAGIIGGCCRVGPREIAAICAALQGRSAGC